MPDNKANNSIHEVAVRTSALTRKFGDLIAVDRVTLTINQGEIFGLIGPNGAGKSTLIKMLTTLLPPSSGSATVAGCDIVRQSAEVRRHIGYVPQLLSADGSLTGYENLLLSARLYGVPWGVRAERITRALERTGLSEAAHHLVRHYSGGMIRRLEIAQSLLHRPTVLFLDEPTVGPRPQCSGSGVGTCARSKEPVPPNYDSDIASHGRNRRLLRSHCAHGWRLDCCCRHSR